MTDRRVYATLAGALATALLINFAVLLTARATGGGVSAEEEQILMITVGSVLVLIVAGAVALAYFKSRR